MVVSSRRRLRRSVRQILEELGSTPDEVAASLARYGVRGRPSNGANCAIARYLRPIVCAEPSVTGVYVRESSLDVKVSGWLPPVRVRLPRAAAAFVRSFDAGLYPELDEGRRPQQRPSPERSS